MSAVREATAALKGSLQIESPKPGHGAIIRFLFPLSVVGGRHYSSTPCTRPSLVPLSEIRASVERRSA